MLCQIEQTIILPRTLNPCCICGIQYEEAGLGQTIRTDTGATNMAQILFVYFVLLLVTVTSLTTATKHYFSFCHLIKSVRLKAGSLAFT